MSNRNTPPRTESPAPQPYADRKRKALLVLVALAVALGVAARADAQSPGERRPCGTVVLPPLARCYTPGDYDGDRKADIAVFRGYEGSWFYLKSSGSGQMVTLLLGGETDRPVPGDYDGDLREDWAIYRRAERKWWVFRSSDETVETASMPDIDCTSLPGDCRPAPGDYDGDGKTDFAVTRLGIYNIRRSTNGERMTVPVLSSDAALDNHNDINVPGDYDGDGVADPAIYDEVEATSEWRWVINRTRDGQIIVPLGEHGDLPAPGDYNGDGKTDVAVFRPSDGMWYIVENLDAGAGLAAREVHWGSMGDVPVAADYDGDGRADYAVWRPADQNWHINYSTTDQHYSRKFGLFGDIPIPLVANRHDHE